MRYNDYENDIRIDYGTYSSIYNRIASDTLATIKNGSYIKVPSPKQKAMNSITNVIFNNPATIVFWSDGTKTVVKCDERDEFDPEKGLAMAICKKHFGGGFYNDIFKKWIPKEETPKIEIDGQITMTEIAEKFEKLAKAAKSMFGPWDD
jgi:hypothetical protein